MSVYFGFNSSYLGSYLGSNVTFEQCNIYSMKNNSVEFYKGYNGIPENFLINLGGWAVCITVFFILRHFSVSSSPNSSEEKNRSMPAFFYGESSSTEEPENPNRIDDSYDVDILQTRKTESTFSCMKNFFTLNDREIMKRCGADAVQYLSFQKHCILYTTIIFIATLIIIIPVNITGYMESQSNRFGITTIGNLDPESPLLWVHVLFSTLCLPLCLFIMWRFSRTLVTEEEDSTVCRTVMIAGVSRRNCDKGLMIRHFNEAYPSVKIMQVHFAYDIRKVEKFEIKRKKASSARHYCEQSMEQTGDRLIMRPYKCGICCNCPCCKEVDALVFYQEEEEYLMEEVARHKAIALNKAVGIAFVTFETPAMAKLVKNDYRRRFQCRGKPVTSSVSPALNSLEWEVLNAPAPNDILWSNLSYSRAYYWGRAWTINIILFIVLFFLTTPAVVFDNLYLINLVEKLQKVHPEASHFLPTFLLWAASILLPFIVTFSNEYMNHWTRSEYNYSAMRKTYTFLLFMIVILPSLGLTSMKALVEWLLRGKEGKENFRWECMFLPDSGAFFVKYVTTTAFIGTALELIRFAELLKYIICLGFARSVAEKNSVRKLVTWEFAFGQQYSWFLLIFSMVNIYCIACPVIVPFGVVCLIMKHLVDKHNIYYVYTPSKINLEIHHTAVTIVLFSLLVQQISFFFFSLLRSGWTPVSIVSLTLCAVQLLVFLILRSVKMYEKLKALAAKEQHLVVEAQSAAAAEVPSKQAEDLNFSPNVLQADNDNISVDHSHHQFQGRTYGTNEDSVQTTPVKSSSDTRELLDDRSYQNY